jgi:hypothetical protein
MDGCVRDDPDGWDLAPWMSYGDIVESGPSPYYHTASKLLYDDEYFYVGAVLGDEHVWGTLTEDQSFIFHDNDWEIFLDLCGEGNNYYEFEINALGTTWQLTLDKPYSKGGSARNIVLPGLVSAVHVDGTLNNPTSEPDCGWSVTVALPLDQLAQFGGGPVVPGKTVWRANFSRVQWRHRIVDDGQGGKRYERVPPHGTDLPQGSDCHHPESNWTWCRQAVCYWNGLSYAFGCWFMRLPSLTVDTPFPSTLSIAGSQHARAGDVGFHRICLDWGSVEENRRCNSQQDGRTVKLSNLVICFQFCRTAAS